MVDDLEGPQKFLEASGAQFEGAPKDAVEGLWVTAFASRVLASADVLELEGETLMVAAKRILRASEAFNRRVVLPADNLPLALAACAGRGASQRLLRPLRKLACRSLLSGIRTCSTAGNHVLWP